MISVAVILAGIGVFIVGCMQAALAVELRDNGVPTQASTVLIEIHFSDPSPDGMVEWVMLFLRGRGNGAVVAALRLAAALGASCSMTGAGCHCRCRGRARMARPPAPMRAVGPRRRVRSGWAPTSGAALGAVTSLGRDG